MKQPRAVTVTDSTGAVSASHPAYFTASSVLTCPVDGTHDCALDGASTADDGKHQGLVSLLVAQNAAADDYYVWAMGGGKAVPTAAVTDPADLAAAQTAAASGYTFIGMIEDYESTGTAYTVDISVIMPDTEVVIDTANLAATVAQVDLQFTTAECVGVVDVTADDNAGGVGFNNLDVENIECSGRGECDRTAGACKCFEGYTGLACGEQTILI